MKKDSLPIRPTQARGFTLLELMVAMSITVILLGIVTYLTSMSMDTYKKSRDQVRSARQAKEALDAIGKDFQSMVLRKDGNDFEWLHAEVEPELVGDTAANITLAGPANKKITNACRVIFFAGAADRYGGDASGGSGDVSAVSYRLVYRDQISNEDPDADGAHPVFTLYRQIIDPDETFLGREINPGPPPTYDATKALLGVPNLKEAYELGGVASHESDSSNAENVLVENVYELTMTFLVQVTLVDDPINPDPDNNVSHVLRVTIKDSDVSDFSVSGNGLSWSGTIRLPENKSIQSTTSQVQFTSGDLNGRYITPAIIKAGQVVGVEISITVLSDQGLVLAQKSGIPRGEIIEEYGYHFTKTINVPRL